MMSALQGSSSRYGHLNQETYCDALELFRGGSYEDDESEAPPGHREKRIAHF